MPKLMHIACSPQRDSTSGAGARGFLDIFQVARPNWDVDDLGLWREGLPDVNQTMLDAKESVLAGRDCDDVQRNAWAGVERMAVRFALADRVLISTPMWNFGLPYKLKHYIDIINQPRLTFHFEPARGYVPLLKDRPTVVILSSGGDFVTGMNRGRVDMATPYLREALKFMGVTEVEFVRIGPTAGPQDQVRYSRDRAWRELRQIATRF
jgi:FMN-dependent NADH-azoreductase